jgi:ubiquinone/menaquinone biosynthesis C-methylase UbiE
MKNPSYDEKAIEWAERMRSGNNHAHNYLEKPAMYAKLPPLKGKTVLCIGCGSGEECEHLLKCGARKVVGIDASKKLIAIAKESYPDIDFRVEDMQKMKFPHASFDFVYSSLAMHYLSDWQSTLKKIYRLLKPRGTFLFSTHHPVYWSGEMIQARRNKARLLGYEKIGARLKRIYGDYQTRRQIHDVWFGNMAVSYYHKPLAEIFHEIRSAGFVVADFLEPKPRPALRKMDADEYLLYSRFPMFMIFELKRAKD